MNRNTIFTLVFVIILGVMAYMWYGYLALPTDTDGAEQASFTKTLAEVRRLKNLKLDTSIFQDRFFLDLEEPQEIPQPAVEPGRENPFAPFR